VLHHHQPETRLEQPGRLVVRDIVGVDRVAANVPYAELVAVTLKRHGDLRGDMTVRIETGDTTGRCVDVTREWHAMHPVQGNRGSVRITRHPSQAPGTRADR
jgi:hypothetical protein